MSRESIGRIQYFITHCIKTHVQGACAHCVRAHAPCTPMHKTAPWLVAAQYLSTQTYTYATSSILSPREFALAVAWLPLPSVEALVAHVAELVTRWPSCDAPTCCSCASSAGTYLPRTHAQTQAHRHTGTQAHRNTVYTQTHTQRPTQARPVRRALGACAARACAPHPPPGAANGTCARRKLHPDKVSPAHPPTHAIRARPPRVVRVGGVQREKGEARGGGEVRGGGGVQSLEGGR